MNEASEASEASVIEEEIIDEADATDNTDAISKIYSITQLAAYVREHQLDNEKGADIQALADYSKNPKIDDLIAEAKSKGDVAEYKPGFLRYKFTLSRFVNP
jgi:hypothetical protein